MDAEASDAFLAVRMGDGSIPSERQGGIRVVLPSQYAFKSIKHLDCVIGATRRQLGRIVVELRVMNHIIM